MVRLRFITRAESHGRLVVTTDRGFRHGRFIEVPLGATGHFRVLRS